jgi:hypothetical protein
MSITVKQISDLSIKNKDIDILIKEQLNMIDDKLLHSDRSWGNNCITHDLPTNLIGLPGLDKADAQRIIYTSIICSLEKRGFEVKIVLNDISSILYISWKSELDKKDIDSMNSIIKKRRINIEDLNNLRYK